MAQQSHELVVPCFLAGLSHFAALRLTRSPEIEKIKFRKFDFRKTRFGEKLKARFGKNRF
jgi:hypothetical protein